MGGGGGAHAASLAHTHSRCVSKFDSLEDTLAALSPGGRPRVRKCTYGACARATEHPCVCACACVHVCCVYSM